MKGVIMAGGTGTRLWPVSRKNSPKQVQPFGDSQTLLEKTYRRLRRGWNEKDIFVSTSTGQVNVVRRQLRGIHRSHFIVEPVRRDTSAAIGLVAAYLHHDDPNAVMFTANSDAYMKDVPKYLQALKVAEKVVRKYPERTVLLGIKPRFADTGLGYIKMKKQIDTVAGHDVFLVDRFVEKPNQKTAEQYVQSWQYLWNPAMFVFRADAMLEKYNRWLPSSYKLLKKIAAARGTAREAAVLKSNFPRLKKISIDYGIMEKDRSMLVVPIDLQWADIGNWGEVYNMLAGGTDDNLSLGRQVHYDSHGNLIFSYSGKLIATAGVRNMIIIETKDALLICPRHRAQDVKHVVAELERQGFERYL